MKYLTTVFTYIVWIGLAIGITGCDNPWPAPPLSVCVTQNCADLQIQVVTPETPFVNSRYTVLVKVTNIGRVATGSDATITALFHRTGGRAEAVPVNVPAGLGVGKSMTPTLMADSTNWPYFLEGPDKLNVAVNTAFGYDDSNSANNSVDCEWSDKASDWAGLSCPVHANVVAQADTDKSNASGTTSDAVQLVDSKKELFQTASSNFASDAQGPFAGKYFGIIGGIDNTSAPFMTEFVEGSPSRVGLELLPGLKIDICDSSGPVYSFFDAADVTVSGNSFTTGALETKNGAKVTLNGTLSEDGKVLDLSMHVDPDDASCSKTLTASAQKLIVPLDLTLRLDGYASQAVVGQDLKYELSIINTGRVSAQSAVLYATIPASLHLKAPAAGSCKPQGNDQVCQIPIAKLDPSQSQALELVFDTTNVQGTALQSSFELVAEGDPSLDIAPAGNVAKVSHQVTTASDLSITKTHSPDPVAPGVAVTYTLGVTNNGPSTAHAVVLSDTVPDVLSFVSVTVANVKGTCLPPRGEPPIITCNLGTMASGATAVVTIVAVPKAEAKIISFANIVAQEADSDPTNNTVAERTLVSYYYSYMPVVLWDPLANLTIIGMTIAPTTGVSADSMVTITLTLKNVGEGPTRNEFYVDLYVNPKRPPEKPLDVWNLLCKTKPDDTCPNDLGIAWLITRTVAPGETITLSSVASDPYLVSDQTRWSGKFGTVGIKQLWAYVDPWGEPGVAWAAVEETNEGDNILGPVSLYADGRAEAATAAAAGEPASATEPMPIRPWPKKLEMSGE